MKKSKLNKFETKKMIDNSSVHGGATGSDITFTDSKRDRGSYDIAVVSLMDTVDSSTSLDKP